MGQCKHLFPLSDPRTRVTMVYYKGLVAILLLCFIHGSLSKPTTENDLTEGRGIGSTIWGWITYPFTWWYKPVQSPVSDPIIESSTYGPYEVIEVGKPNITVLCNDQTCTTTKCDEYGCRNITCNIYDTDLTGICREYNTIKPEEIPVPNKPIPEPIQENVAETTTSAIITTSTSTTSTQKDNNPVVDEHPLALEAILSSTVSKDVQGSKELVDAAAL